MFTNQEVITAKIKSYLHFTNVYIGSNNDNLHCRNKQKYFSQKIPLKKKKTILLDKNGITLKFDAETSKMNHLVRALAAKPEDLSLIPRIH